MKPDARRRPLLRWRRRPTAAPHNRCSRVSPPSSLSPLSLLPLLPIPPPLVVAPSVRWRDAPPRCWLRFPRRGSVSLAALSSSLHLPSPPTASGPTLDLAGGPGGADLSLRTVATDVPHQFQCWSRRLGANLRFGLSRSGSASLFLYVVAAGIIRLLGLRRGYGLLADIWWLDAAPRSALAVVWSRRLRSSPTRAGPWSGPSMLPVGRVLGRVSPSLDVPSFLRPPLSLGSPEP